MTHRHTEPIPRRRVVVTLMLAAASVVLLVSAGVHLVSLRAAEEDAKDEAVQTAEQLCDQIESMGRTCVTQPPQEPKEGKPGRGIADTHVEDRCFIRIVYDDNTSALRGPFCGEDGKDGSPGPSGSPGAKGDKGDEGPQGVSITDVQADGCDVVLTFSNGETRRVGPFCGPPGEDGDPGRSVIDTDCVGEGRDSDWVFTYREPDGSTTTERVNGPCRLKEPGDPSPTPPPLGGN